MASNTLAWAPNPYCPRRLSRQMTIYSPNKLVRSTGSEQGLLNIARQVSETIGTEFFSLLVNQLGEVLGAECVYIGELLRGRIDRVQTLAAWIERRKMESFEFPLAGTPDAEVAKGTPCMYATGALEAFPDDRLLRDLEAQAWVGIP